MKFFIKDFFGKCDEIRSFLRIWSHLLKKFLMENFIFCAVFDLSCCLQNEKIFKDVLTKERNPGILPHPWWSSLRHFLGLDLARNYLHKQLDSRYGRFYDIYLFL